MSRAELDAARAALDQHVKDCAACRGFDYSPRTAGRLCFNGSQQYKKLLELEHKESKRTV